jgi:glucosamine-6-phosphate deaminase
MKTFNIDKLEVRVYEDRTTLGLAAAEAVSARMRQLLAEKREVNMVFAAAPSQNEFLSVLVGMDVEWGRVNAFHMDEYIGLAKDAPQGFGNFLRDRLFSRVGFKAVYYMDGLAVEAGRECERYGRLLEQHPTDIVVLGIGENTHLAFNDPHVARFDDAELVKVVDLDEESRRQQVNDGCFAELGAVPTHAMTMTIPALMRARYAYVVVPGRRKAEAVRLTLYADIGERYPSTALRQHSRAAMFIDDESAAMISDGRTAGGRGPRE